MHGALSRQSSVTRLTVCQPLAPAFCRRTASAEKIDEVLVPPREARCFEVPAGHFFRIVSVEGSQVGDLNLWQADNLDERFYAGKTRALHGTHLSTGDRLWSSFPFMRPLARITYDTLDWYGWDADGGSVHDVIGTRCDPYTAKLLADVDYHHCCHSNLIRALADHRQLDFAAAEPLVHDVLNVFMCTGFTRDTHQYFMKASPVRPGDFIEFFAETDLLGGLSACPGVIVLQNIHRMWHGAIRCWLNYLNQMTQRLLTISPWPQAAMDDSIRMYKSL